MPTDKIVLFFEREPRDNSYKALLKYACSKFPYFQFVIRPELGLNKNGERVRTELEEFEQSRLKTRKWPGTELFTEEFATAFKYDLNEQSAKILAKTVRGLYDWQQPDFPEDLCILRLDGTPWLVTIAHESYAHLEITEDEKVELLSIFGKIIEER